MTTTVESPLRWDLARFFPGPDSPEFQAVLTEATAAIAALASWFDQAGIAGDGAAADEATVAAAIDRLNGVLTTMRLLEMYLFCLTEDDSRDERAQAAAADLRLRRIPLTQLETRFTAWVGTLDLEPLIERSAVIRDHAAPLRRLQQVAAHQMPPGEEALAAELAPTGGSAWGRLRHDLAARLTATLAIDGEERERPITEIENIARHDPDRAVRQRAFAAEASAWRSQQHSFVAALNGVKGETLTLTARRGWGTPLDAALSTNAIDQATLDALMTAIDETIPDYRRYLRAKARLLGLPVLASYDLGAPVGSSRVWPYEEALAFVIDCFHGYSPKLAALAERAAAERWVDVEPREGKGGGGFCEPIGTEGESRILLNYAPDFDWMGALAHELGHAYHHAIIAERGRTPLQDRFPPSMSLVETASTFCETLAVRAALAGADDAEALGMLDGTLRSVALNVFNTAGLFAFERDLFAARRERDLSFDEIEGMMNAAQRSIFGDAVDPETLIPLRWAHLPHYFLDEIWFYNFPYAFGMLFGQGLLAVYRTVPDGFHDRFDDLLSATGMTDAADLAARFGLDLRHPDFWRASLATFRADVDRFETLSGG